MSHLKLLALVVVATVLSHLTTNAQFSTTSGNTTTADKVGIGTTSPGALLSLSAASVGWNQQIYAPAIAAGDLNGIRFYSGYSTGENKWSGIANVTEDLHSNKSGLSFYTNYDGLSTEKLRILGNGKVGIGTTLPVSKLDLHQGFAGAYNETAALTFSTDNGTDNWSLGQISGYVSAGVNNSGQGWPGGLLFKTKNADSNPNSLPSTKMALDADGNLSIGTMNPKGYKLAVNGSMIATSVQVMLYDAWPDYVFKPTYRLKPLAEVKTYIDQNQHLPGMPSAAEVQKDGLNLGEMNKLLTQKVEELTLYLIEQKKENEIEKKKNADQLAAMQRQLDDVTRLVSKVR